MTRRRYTEEDLRTALADPAVCTMADLCRALGLAPRGANYETVRAYATTLAIDLDDLLPPHHVRGTAGRQNGSSSRARNRPSYSDEQLLEALADPSIDSYPALCAALGLRPLTNTYRRLRERAEALGTPIPRSWSRRGPRKGGHGGRRAPAVSRQELEAAIATARSLAGTIRAMGQHPSASTYRWLRAAIELHEVDTSHFAPYRRSNPGRRPRPLSELLVNGRGTNSVHLKRRLIREGIREPRCAICGLTEWNGAPIPLELDHIDGDRRNNLLENLRLVCPNCHAQTPTYRGRNIGRRRATDQG